MMTLVVTPYPAQPGMLDSHYPEMIAQANRCGWGNSLDLVFEENLKTIVFDDHRYYLHRISCPYNEARMGVAFLVFAFIDRTDHKRIRYNTPFRRKFEEGLQYVRGSRTHQNIDVVYKDECQAIIAYGNCNWTLILEAFERLDSPQEPDLYNRCTLRDFLQ